MNYLHELQDARNNYDCPWSELPAKVRQHLAHLKWLQTPPLEPFSEWTPSRESYVWRELIADMIKSFTPNQNQNATYARARNEFLSSVFQSAWAWAEKAAEDDYDAEFEEESAPFDRATLNESLRDMVSENAERMA